MRNPHLVVGDIERLIARAEELRLSPEAKERLHWLSYLASHDESITATSRQFGIARTTLHRWLDRFDASDPYSLEERSVRKIQPATPANSAKLKAAAVYQAMIAHLTTVFAYVKAQLTPVLVALKREATRFADLPIVQKTLASCKTYIRQKPRIVAAGILGIVALGSIFAEAQQLFTTPGLRFLNGNTQEMMLQNDIVSTLELGLGKKTAKGLIVKNITVHPLSKPATMTRTVITPNSQPLFTQQDTFIPTSPTTVIHEVTETDPAIEARKQARLAAMQLHGAAPILDKPLSALLLTLGPVKNGQVLVFQNGKFQWADLTSLTVGNIDTGRGRIPTGGGSDYRGGGVGGDGSTGGSSFTLPVHDHQNDAGGGVLDINAATKGILQVNKGGTGIASYSTGDLLVGGADHGLSALGMGTNGQLLTVTASGTLAWKNLNTTATGNILTIGDSHYVRKTGDTMTGGLVINLSSGYLGLRVMQTLSGSIIHAEKSLTSSGFVLANGNISTRGTLSGAALTVMNDASSILGNLTVGTTLNPGNAKLNVAGTISGSQLVISGAASISGSTLVKGNLTTKGTLSGASLVVSGSKSCSALITDINGTVSCGSGFQNTAANDARYVRKSGDTMTGALRISAAGVGLNVNGTMSGSALTVMNGTSYLLGNVGIGKSGTPNTKLEVVGTISGSQLVISGAASISGSTLVKGNLTTKGTLSGASLVVSGSKTCYVLKTDGNGVVSCGTLTPSWGTGNTLTVGDSRYVRKSGDMMTGALSINLSSGYLGLRVMQTLSGSIIHAEKSLTSSGFILANGNITSRGTLSGAALTVMNGNSYLLGNVGIGTTGPRAKLEIDTGAIGTKGLIIRGTPNAMPTDYSGLSLWLKADSLALNDGDLVSTWTDSSGNGDNATATSTARPTYKTGIVNGKPVLRYTSTNNLDLGSYISTARSIFVVYKPILDFSKTYMLILGHPGVYDFFGTANTAGNPIFNSTYVSANVSGGSAWVNGTSTNPLSVLWQPNFSVLSLQTTGNTNIGALANDRNSASNDFIGDYAEVIVYNRVLTSTERQNVEAYLLAKYGIAGGTFIPQTSNLLVLLSRYVRN